VWLRLEGFADGQIRFPNFGFLEILVEVTTLLGCDAGSLSIWSPPFRNNILVSSSRAEIANKNGGEWVDL
jgi:hypothetical protein